MENIPHSPLPSRQVGSGHWEVTSELGGELGLMAEQQEGTGKGGKEAGNRCQRRVETAVGGELAGVPLS